MKVLVTGAAGFIGMHVCLRLLARGDAVIGVDNLNDYYDVRLKQARLAMIGSAGGNWRFEQAGVEDGQAMARLFDLERPLRVVHLAAQAGVRHSLTHPHSYTDSNLSGFLNVLEGCRHQGVEHLVYASSSSVYGANACLPFSEGQAVDHPVSLYAATKKANELMAHAYSHLFSLPCTGLRLFTVYGPWGRPDMAPMLFARAMLSNEPIAVFNGGRMARDFTYIDDAVEAIVRVIDRPATRDALFDPESPDPATAAAPWRVFNVGQGRPTGLIEFICALENGFGVSAWRNEVPMQPGDVQATAADCARLDAWIGTRDATPLSIGVARFVDWYRNHYSNPC